MNKILKIGIVIAGISFLGLNFPFSPDIMSISQTFDQCQLGNSDLQTAFLNARGACVGNNVLYGILSAGIPIGIIMIIIGAIKKETKKKQEVKK